MNIETFLHGCPEDAELDRLQTLCQNCASKYWSWASWTTNPSEIEICDECAAQKDWRGDYRRLLQTKEWKDFRRSFLSQNPDCVQCYAPATQVHHTRYLPGVDPWKYFSYDLEALCEDCHKERHDE